MKWPLLFVLLAVCVVPSLSARGSNDEVPTELNISYVKSPFNLQVMVMKEKGMLEKEFGADGITVNWHEITSGAKQAQAMAAGSLDIASVMNTASVIFANSAGNAVDIIDIVSRPEQTFAIMVMDDGPRTVEDLTGAVVAGPKGTVLHQLLVAVEDKEELEDLQFVSMGLPQAQSALIAGDVDAALLAAALVIKTQEAGGRILTTSEGYVTPLLVSVAREGFAEQHPEIVNRFTAVQKEAFDFIMTNPSEALAIGAEVKGLNQSDAKTLFDRSGITEGFTKGDIDLLDADVQFLLNLEMIENPVEPSELLAATLEVN